MYFAKKMQEEALINDKRKTRRLRAPKDFEVAFKKGKFFPRIGSGSGRDISMEGMRFSTTARLKIKDPLSIKLHFSPKFPGQKQIQLKAVVARIQKSKRSGQYRVGCRFQTLDAIAQETIWQFLWWLDFSEKS